MRVLGIDCGCEATGYGLIESDGRKHRLVDAGAIRTSARMPFPERLRRIAEELARLMNAWRPAAVAVEEVFFAVNVKSALKLGHVRGVALLEAARAGLPVSEYSPLEVKSSVVGYGRAEKHQVQGMVQSLLGLSEPPESEDAADALAIAICHAHRALAEQKMAPPSEQKAGRKQKTHGTPGRAEGSRQKAESSHRRFSAQGLLLSAYCLLLLAAALSASAAVLTDSVGLPRLTFIKEFPHSDPDYYRIDLGEDGQARYSTAPDETRAAQFHVSPALSRQAFELAARLNYFRGASLETRKKVASLGKKTVVYESDGVRHEAVFNYSENPDAMALVELFEKISNTRQQLLALERLIHFDKLGLMKQLLSLESALNKHDLAEPALLIPVLEEISRNRSYMHIAQERARIILNKIYDQKSER